jgi:hypothetical protein
MILRHFAINKYELIKKDFKDFKTFWLRKNQLAKFCRKCRKFINKIKLLPALSFVPTKDIRKRFEQIEQVLQLIFAWGMKVIRREDENTNFI